MDQNLKTAAEAGNVSELYELIARDGNVLRRIDKVEFIDTPLHTAAENGCIGFAMEIMSLKPSFARKLNHRGLSPLHLAVEKGHEELVLRLVEIDKDLVRIRGKNGETPFHYLCKVENRHDLLERFLEACPECIRDVTAQNHSALHIAVKNNRLDILKVLTQSLRKDDYCQEVVNRQDEYGNTALHTAAANNQPQMLRLPLKCKADKHVKNLADENALDVARQTESICILRGVFSPKISNSTYELNKKIVKYVTNTSLLIFHGIDNISSDDRNALLVILGLLLTATYQASLSPPGGAWQGESTSNSTRPEDLKLGRSVMDEYGFLILYIPTYIVFLVTFFLTLALLKPYPSGFRTALQALLAFLVGCFDQSIYTIAPTDAAYSTINIFSVIAFILMVSMCISYRVSKFSVSIVGYWMLPFYHFRTIDTGVLNYQFFLGPVIINDGVIPQGVVQGLMLFIFLYDDFWKGSILIVTYSLIEHLDSLEHHSYRNLGPAIVIIGWWLFLHLCRFCIRQRTRFRNLVCN